MFSRIAFDQNVCMCQGSDSQRTSTRGSTAYAQGGLKRGAAEGTTHELLTPLALLIGPERTSLELYRLAGFGSRRRFCTRLGVRFRGTYIADANCTWYKHQNTPFPASAFMMLMDQHLSCISRVPWLHATAHCLYIVCEHARHNILKPSGLRKKHSAQSFSNA
jgi:hypothetical protein